MLRRRKSEPPDSHGEHLAVVAQVAGDEDDEEHLRELAGLEGDRADRDPEVGAVDGGTELGQRRQDQERDREDPKCVLVVVEPPVVLADHQDGQREQGDSDHDPDALAEREVWVDPVDEGQADRGQKTDQREQGLVCLRQPESQDDVRRDEEREKQGRVGQRAGGEGLGVLADDEDAREPGGGQHADEEQVHKLAVPDPQGVASSSYGAMRSRASSYDTSEWSKSDCRSSGESCTAWRPLTYRAR